MSTQKRPRDAAVAVVGGNSLLRRGVAQTISDFGHRCWESRDISAITARPFDIVMALVKDPELELRTITNRVDDHVPVVALLERPSTSTYIASVNSGAHGIAGCDWSRADIVRSLHDALNQRLVMPLAIAQAFASQAAQAGQTTTLNDFQRNALRHLAAGASLTDMALAFAMPTRDVAQRLRMLYDQLGVSGRTEAVRLAHGAAGDSHRNG